MALSDVDWTAPVDIYCERLGPDFWAEPLNALSNLSFVIAGLFGLWLARRLDRLTPLIVALCTLALAIGVGSFLFHTVAQRWAGVADVVPILSFILVYLFAAARYLFGLRWIVAAPAAAGAFALALLARNGVLLISPKEDLNGSEGYAPALALLAGAAILLKVFGRRGAGLIGLAAATFTVSVVARTADSHVCDTFPVGTHFLWHTLNGMMIGILLVAMIRYGEPRQTP